MCAFVCGGGAKTHAHAHAQALALARTRSSAWGNEEWRCTSSRRVLAVVVGGRGLKLGRGRGREHARGVELRMGAAGVPPFSVGRTGKDKGDGELMALPAKDRVALYAQLSPEETTRALLDALRENASGAHGAHRAAPAHADEGIEALYAFANFDVWSVRHQFFGWNMDLGQFERFRRVLLARPFSTLLGHSEREVLSALHLSSFSYATRVRVLDASGHTHAVFRFKLSRVERPNRAAHWMVDSLCHEISTTAHASSSA
mmetsp:Transcript_6408/g.17162  ORF Transcript_6408/g.17162 Transcript_6408/m.17162 type:complete len:259 (-) Transcript_6408:798-1574(-)